MKNRLPCFVAVLSVALITAACGESEPPRVIPEGIPPGAGTPVPEIDVNAVGRTADLLLAWADPQADALNISASALAAYAHAAAVMSDTSRGCGIAWTTLAGIGYIESRHGTYQGSSVAPDGTVSPLIRGIPLDGGPGVAEIPDTDGGVMDGDPVHDRAMGPMQFIPETWKKWGVDANGDGVANPDNLDDAALTAARYLCARGGDLLTAEGWERALMAYNQSGAYLRDVRDAAAAYSVGTAA
ncbi:lytic transglycosylase domain-containing protein [Rhodococcus sp. G-MC3]|nr:lytic transglycosylase domain-containing protein [Rhodococcus sp. G-MC3]MDJ0394037.1 lytic transglycosylase domain-containing protein [Rhodococcus sp. G-MC3]